MTFHTVEEAKKLWCPQARVAIVGIHGINRIDQSYRDWAEGKDKEFMARQEQNGKCIGPDCMMWQWMTNVQSGAGCSIGRDGRDEWPRTDGNRGADGTPTPPATARGYCGLCR